MTCREKLKIQHPYKVTSRYIGGCCGCPHDYGYLSKPIGCDEGQNHELCTKCWDREIPETESVNDPVNHPSHYTDGKIEVIDFIEDKKLGFHLGNAVKYICRAGKKDPTKTVQDLKKAVWYIERHIAGLGD